MIERKRRRGRAESDWPTYVEQTRARITSLQAELIAVHATGDIKKVYFKFILKTYSRI